MLAFHGALTTVDYVDDRRQRVEATEQSVVNHDRCVEDDVTETATVEGRRRTTRARSVPLDTSESTCRRLVSRGTQTSALAKYISACVATAAGDDAWLRRIDAMDLSFPVSRQSELRSFLADTLVLAEQGAGADRKQVAAGATPRTPTMRRRRWAAFDLYLDDGPSAATGVDDRPATVLDDDPEDWTDDDDDDDEMLSAVSDGGGSFVCTVRPCVISQRTPDCSAAKTRSHFRSGCRTVSRHPAPNMPMIREDEQTSSADDDDDDDQVAGDIPTANRRCPPPAARLSPLRPLQNMSTCGEWTRRSPATVAWSAGVALASCSRRLVETPTNDDGRQPASPTSTSPSLLDAMHKKYCAVQYVRRRAQHSTPGYHGNAHLSDAVNRTSLTRQKDARPSADRDCVTVGDFVARQADVAERVTGSHATSCRVDCGAAPNSMVGMAKKNSVDACISTTPSEDVTSSQNATGFDDDGDDDEEEDDEREVVEQESKKFTELCDDKPWKKRFCDLCHGELEVKRHSLPSPYKSVLTLCIFFQSAEYACTYLTVMFHHSSVHNRV